MIEISAEEYYRLKDIKTKYKEIVGNKRRVKSVYMTNLLEGGYLVPAEAEGFIEGIEGQL